WASPTASSCRSSSPPTWRTRRRTPLRSRAQCSASSSLCRQGSSGNRTCPCRPYPCRWRAPDISPGQRSHEGHSPRHEQPIAPQHGLDCRIRHVALMHDAALAEMNFGELAVGVGKLQPDRARGLAPAAPDFGKGVFEPIDHVDAHAMLGPRHRIEDRLTAAFRHSRHDQARLSGGYIDLKVYRGKDRIMPFFQRGREYVEDRRPGFRILPADDTQQRGSLRLRRPLVNYYYRFPFALMDGAGPAQDADE